MGLHYKFYANPLLCHLLILCTCNPHQQCSLIRYCVIYLCIFYKTYSWGFIEDLGMLTRLYLASFLQCTYINFFSGFMYLGDKLNLLYHALYVQGIFAHIFSYLSHIFYAKHWMHLPIWFQVEFCWSRTFICEPDVAHSFPSTISTSGGFGMKMPLLSLLSELWLLLFYTLFSVFPSYHTRFQLRERQTIKITLVKYSFLKRNIIV